MLGVSLGLLAVAGIILAVVLVVDSDDAEAGQVFLDPATETGREPFTDSVAAADVRPIASEGTPATTGTTGDGPVEVPSSAGSEPGLYGGTQNQATCDRLQLVEFLLDNPDKASAWADVQGIPLADITDYITDLTPMQLRADTQVTNHGFRDGRATEYQAVLEAGTAVLVDRQGVPRTRCACGNPLTPPQPTNSRPRYTGTRWAGFSETNIQVVVVDVTVEVFVLVDVDTGEAFERPPGTDGQSDAPADIADGGSDGPTGTSPDTTTSPGELPQQATYQGVPSGSCGDPTAELAQSFTFTLATGTLTATTEFGSASGTVADDGTFTIEEGGSSMSGTVDADSVTAEFSSGGDCSGTVVADRTD